MSETSWFAVQLVSAICAGTLSVFAAVLLFLDTAIEDSRRSRIKARAKEFLSAVEHSPLSHLPDHVLALGNGLRALRVGLMQRIVYENTILTHIVAWAAAVPCVWLVGRQYGRVVLLSIVAGMILEGVCKRLHWVRTGQILGDTSGTLLAVLGFAAALREAIDWAGTPFGILIAIGISPIGLVIADMLLSFGSETNHDSSPNDFRMPYTTLVRSLASVRLSR